MESPKKSRKKGRLFVLSAPAGTGKSTLVDRIKPKLPHLHQTVSYTTRRPRKNEIDGVHYHFVSKEKFEKLIQDGVFLEYVKLYDDYYGTPEMEVDQWIERGEDALLVIDVEGMKKVANKRKIISIFLLPPDFETLRERLLKRGTETEASLKKRLDIAKLEIKERDMY
ncbi:MAG: guanylate kinase, partial [Parachlamydiaceae bacterium]